MIYPAASRTYVPLPPSKACACGIEGVIDPRYDAPFIRPWHGPFHYFKRWIIAGYPAQATPAMRRQRRPPLFASSTWTLEVHYRFPTR